MKQTVIVRVAMWDVKELWQRNIRVTVKDDKVAVRDFSDICMYNRCKSTSDSKSESKRCQSVSERYQSASDSSLLQWQLCGREISE